MEASEILLLQNVAKKKKNDGLKLEDLGKKKEQSSGICFQVVYFNS